ncbi:MULTISPECIES: HGxxPAAW family protein [unclassified Kitasatospora]|uniref:HGxxPAAW family protein n=1 Tax=unclassified Kitasatospora TaxID=2633591 RepID=UPI000AF4512B|nr:MULTISPECIES: HGxxPAAW family protein [unclassified Kitasatospora]
MSGMHGHHDMGHTVAGWTGSALVFAGFGTAGVAMCAAWLPGVWLGAGLVCAGALASWLLHLAGWGKPSGPRPAEQWDWRVRDTSHHPDCLGCRLAARPQPLDLHGRRRELTAAQPAD